MNRPKVLEADLTLTPSGWERGVRVAVHPDGTIRSVDRGAASPAGTASPPVRLAGKALIPGFVNAHSHAFQRGLRGRGESFPEGAGSFWSWREAMYSLVERLDPDAAYDLSRQAFGEMRGAGITSVGEFHYLHHDRSGRGYAMDEAVIRAAADAGIRLVLLFTAYHSGGFGEPLQGGQLRFCTGDASEFWGQIDALQRLLDPSCQTLGVAAHSIRAVALDEIAALHEESVRRGLVFHMHLEEQRAEIEACLAHYGATPLSLLNDRLEVDARTTLVHCTHSEPLELARFLAAGGNVCLCPLTEANLGDGLADLPLLLEKGEGVSLGTDSNARISMLEEMRLLEYGQRLRSAARGIARNAAGAVAPVLLDCATARGARSLGLDAGAIAPGLAADFAVVDLGHPSLAGWDEDSLLAALIFGASDGAIAGGIVGGKGKLLEGLPGSG